MSVPIDQLMRIRENFLGHIDAVAPTPSQRKNKLRSMVLFFTIELQ